MTSGRARLAITTIFFLNGAAFSSWYARLPAIQEDLGLSEGLIGIALLGAPLGLLLTQPFVGAIVSRRGSRPVLAATPLILIAVVLPALANNFGSLLLAVLAVGAANGGLDVAMNVQGLAVEASVGRAIFNSLHASFSLGALAGASIAALIAAAGIDPLPHLVGVACVGAAIAAVAARFLLPDEEEADATAPRFARPSRPLLALAIVAFCALLAEGAVFDWSSIYLRTVIDAPESVAPLGLAAFSLTMFVGRLLGDGAATRFGATATAVLGSALAALGQTLAIVLGGAPGVILGFGIMGLGLSVVFPLTLRSAGRREGSTGPAIAAVSTLGYVGFLLGPPAIGFTAEAVGLRGALLLVTLCCGVAAVVSRVAIDEGRDH